MRALANALIRRPLFCAALGLCLGVAVSPIFPKSFLFFAGLAGLTALVLAWQMLSSKRQALAALAFAVAGLAGGALRVQPLLQLWQAPGQAAVTMARLEAQVFADLGEREESGRRVLLLENVRVKDLESADDAKLWQGRVRLSFEPDPSAPALGPGDRIAFLGSIRPTQEASNPGEFRYRAFLLGRGITAQASSRKAAAPEQLSRGSAWQPRRLAWIAWTRLIQGLEQSGLSPRAVALTRGMVLGDTGSLTNRDMSVYARTGLVHILSVSGLHMALAMSLFLLLGKSAGLSRRGLAWMALPFAFGYAMICGMPVPCQRALCLFVFVLLGQALDLDTDLATSLGLGAILILLIQPGALFEAGTQLSFLVSLGLVTLTPLIQKNMPESWPRWLQRGLAATLAAELASVPLVAWHFGVYCWPALVATLLTAPLMGPVVGLGLLNAVLGYVAPSLALLTAWPLEWVLKTLDWITSHLALLPLAAFSVGRPAFVWMFLWFAAVLAFSAWPRKSTAWIFVPLMLGMLWPGLPLAHRHPGETRVWFLDVGQGDAILTEFEDGKVLLVDAGPRLPDAGSWVVGPALRRLGINQVDWAVVTHPHADHAGGMAWVLDQFRVSTLIHSGESHSGLIWPGLLASAQERGVSVLDLSQDATPLAWEGRIRKLSPVPPRLQHSKQDMHNNNVVLEVGGWLLLTGDLQSQGEARLIKNGSLKHIEVLKVGHHGSKTSSSRRFLKAIRPSYAVISAGRHNRFGHPAPQPLRDLAGQTLFRTDLQGCIRVSHDSSGTRFFPWWPATPESLRQAPPRVKRSKWKKFEETAL